MSENIDKNKKKFPIYMRNKNLFLLLKLFDFSSIYGPAIPTIL